jgi:hypothetical protein
MESLLIAPRNEVSASQLRQGFFPSLASNGPLWNRNLFESSLPTVFFRRSEWFNAVRFHFDLQTAL